MLTFALPPDDEAARGGVAVAPLPLADCLLALALIAHGRGGDGTPRLVALRDRLTARETRAVAGLYGPPLPLGLLALGAASAHHDDPARVLAAVRDMPDTAVVAGALALAGGRAPDAPASPGVYQSLSADGAWARAYISRYVVPPPDNPAPLLAAIADPAAARHRVADALAGLITAHLDALLPALATWGDDAAARLREAHATEPARFAARHIPAAMRDVGTVVCFPSAFLRAGSVAFPLSDAGKTLVGVGADDVPRAAAPELIAPVIAEATTYQETYRLLADPVRWEIVRLLVAAPRYGQELAERLHLSVATVSHHLNTLKKLDLVTLERSEHRLYYNLRADRLRALLAGASMGLFEDGGTD